MRNLALISVLVLSGSMTAQTAPAASDSPQFNGTWWLAANPGERSGFINGVADCMTWEGHKKGYSATPEQLDNKITRLYEADPGRKSLSVLEVWQRVSPAPAPTGGERWTNPHWYLNGDWWAQEAQTEQMGFVEGYLWCIRTQIDAPHGGYSKPDSFYWQQINAYVAANPKLGKEAVATTLDRYKDPRK